MKTSTHLLVLLFIVFAVSLSGCTALQTIGGSLFTGSTLKDFRFEGRKSGECKAIEGSGGSEVSVGSQLAGISLGCLLPVMRLGELEPLTVLCVSGSQEKWCNAIPLNGLVSVAGQPLPGSNVIFPSRLTSPDAED